MKRMHDDKELIDLLQEEGFLKEEVKVENINSDNAAQGEVLMADGSGGAEWSEIEAGMENPMTAKDDLIIGGTDGAPARLAKGTNGQVLQVGSDGLEWATPSGGGTETIELTYNVGNFGSERAITQEVYDKLNDATKDYIIKINSTNVNIGNFYSKIVVRDGLILCLGKTSQSYGVGPTTQWYGDYVDFYDFSIVLSSSGGNYYFTIKNNEGSRTSRWNRLDQSKFNDLFVQKNAPSSDGTYVLKCTVVSGVKTYTWVSE